MSDYLHLQMNTGRFRRKLQSDDVRRVLNQNLSLRRLSGIKKKRSLSTCALLTRSTIIMYYNQGCSRKFFICCKAFLAIPFPSPLPFPSLPLSLSFHSCLLFPVHLSSRLLPSPPNLSSLLSLAYLKSGHLAL